MNKRKITQGFIAALLLFGTVFGVSASAGFGSGVAVVAAEKNIIKTGIRGQKIVFSDLDFKQGLAIADFEKIEIKSIPLSSEGTLLLAGRRVKEGTIIKRKNLGALVFIPASKDVAECKFSFTTEDFAEGAEVDFIIKFTDKVNYAPEIDEAISASVTTQREISYFGQMSASDKEGDGIDYMVVSYPKSGALRVIDTATGEYIYTPEEAFTGTDSFSYVARDEWGNFSKLCKVKVEVGERKSEVVYLDMIDNPAYNAAVTLTAMGVTDGEVIGDGAYFMPETKLTREQFLGMAMKCAGIKGDGGTSQSYFDDNDEISAPLLPYVKAAARLGIVTGEFTNGELLMRPKDIITKAEAGMIIAKLVDVKDASLDLEFSDGDTVPVWARDEIYALSAMGILPYDGNTIEGKCEVTKALAVQYLYNMLKFC